MVTTVTKGKKMTDNYCTFRKLPNGLYSGVYCLDGKVFNLTKKRRSMGKAVIDAKIARDSKI